MSEPAITPTDGMVITRDTHLAPGVYIVPNGLKIAADGVTLDGTGTLLIGQDHRGTGIEVQGRRDVTIRGVGVAGYYHGVRCDHSQNVTIDGISVRDTAEVPGIETFLYLWKPITETYGGAILLHDVQVGLVRGCDLQHQQNGVLLYKCAAVTVERINASFNSGWGVYLSESSDNTLKDNLLDFCNRAYVRPDGTQRLEADAAGIVLVQGSSRNRLLRNRCRSGGDGIFVAGYRHPGDVNPCNDNLIEDNDCALSPNNAIESTFSRGNIFRRNNCSGSNYGFWLGFSWQNTLEDNLIEDSRVAGIAAEHAFSMTIRHNTLRRNHEGIRLWTRGISVLEYWPGHEVSFDFTIADNLFEENGIGFHGYTGPETTTDLCHDYHLRGNRFRGNRVAAQLARVNGCSIQENHFSENVHDLAIAEDADVTSDNNHFEPAARTEGNLCG